MFRLDLALVIETEHPIEWTAELRQRLADLIRLAIPLGDDDDVHLAEDGR